MSKTTDMILLCIGMSCIFAAAFLRRVRLLRNLIKRRSPTTPAFSPKAGRRPKRFNFVVYTVSYLVTFLVVYVLIRWTLSSIAHRR